MVTKTENIQTLPEDCQLRLAKNVGLERYTKVQQFFKLLVDWLFITQPTVTNISWIFMTSTSSTIFKKYTK
jgi:hypothetical protein